VWELVREQAPDQTFIRLELVEVDLGPGRRLSAEARGRPLQRAVARQLQRLVGRPMSSVERVLLVGGGVAGMVLASESRKAGTNPERIQLHPYWSILGVGISAQGPPIRGSLLARPQAETRSLVRRERSRTRR